jgi:hypothetical protein
MIGVSGSSAAEQRQVWDEREDDHGGCGRIAAGQRTLAHQIGTNAEITDGTIDGGWLRLLNCQSANGQRISGTVLGAFALWSPTSPSATT